MESTVRRTPFPLALYWSPKRIDGDMLLRQLILMLGPENQPIAIHAVTIVTILTTITCIIVAVMLVLLLSLLLLPVGSLPDSSYQAQNEIYVQLFQTPDEAEEADLAGDYIVPLKYRT